MQRPVSRRPGRTASGPFARIHITLNALPGDFGVTLNGPTTIARGSVRVGPSDRREIPTTMTALDLDGMLESGGETLGPLSVRLNPDQPSTGRIIADGLGSDFPATSFFDIFLQITTPLGILHNDVPIHMHADIPRIPPLFTLYQPDNEPIPLKSSDGRTVGMIRHAAHVPVPPDEFGIVFENVSQ